ncbi:hypothetical protein [Nocardia salmonicida]|uniref:hypothetical protein n=1 Tax=Nocardia salmonicida TaxID=53431 RepID=UPI003796F230
MSTPVQNVAQAFLPAHPNLPRSAGVAASMADEDYVEALARVVYYWAYPGVDTFGRTGMWDLTPFGRTSGHRRIPAAIPLRCVVEAGSGCAW